MKKQVGLAIIGAGMMGKFHIQSFSEIKEARLVGVMDSTLARAKSLASKYGVDAYSDMDKLLTRDDLDGIVVCTPTYTHKSIIVKAAEAGKHVYCEKPMARTLKECDEMIKVAEKNKVKLMVSLVARFYFKKIKTLIDHGVVGDISVIRSSLLAWTPGPDWFYDREKGGGMIIDSSMHCADLLRWLTGSEVNRVYAESGAFVLERSKKAGTEDNAIYMLRFKNGTIGEVYGSWSGKGMGGYILEVFGNRGTIFSHPLNQPLMVFSEKNIPKASIPKGINLVSFEPWLYKEVGWLDAIDHFVKCVLKDENPMISGRDGKAALEIVLAACKSAQTHKPVWL